MKLPEPFYISKSKNVFLLFGKRDQIQTSIFHLLSLDLLEIIFSPFASLRIFETRYFQSRLLILNSLKSMELNPKNLRISISHSKYSFACLVMPKYINAAVDIEPLSRNLPDQLRKKISDFQYGIKLHPIKYLSLLETFIKLKAISWNEIKAPFLIENTLVYNKAYRTRMNNKLIYSKFYNYKTLSVCISSGSLEFFK